MVDRLISVSYLQKSKYSEEASVRAKLEVSKRKLHEGYQQADNGMIIFLKILVHFIGLFFVYI